MDFIIDYYLVADSLSQIIRICQPEDSYVSSRYYDPDIGRFINADVPTVVIWWDYATALMN